MLEAYLLVLLVLVVQFKFCRIVTCSADRNAYVWVKQDDGTWKHTLVLLRLRKRLMYFWVTKTARHGHKKSKVLCFRFLASERLTSEK